MSEKMENNTNIETYFFLIVMGYSNEEKIFLAISNDVVTIFFTNKEKNYEPLCNYSSAYKHPTDL